MQSYLVTEHANACVDQPGLGAAAPGHLRPNEASGPMNGVNSPH